MPIIEIYVLVRHRHDIVRLPYLEFGVRVAHTTIEFESVWWGPPAVLVLEPEGLHHRWCYADGKHAP